MASDIKRGESIFIPFRNGTSIYDSQCKPRMYKTIKEFEKHFPGHYLGKDGVELVEYAEVVRRKDCKHWCTVDCEPNYGSCSKLEDRYKEDCESSFDETTRFDDFCSYGERKDND